MCIYTSKLFFSSHSELSDLSPGNWLMFEPNHEMERENQRALRVQLWYTPKTSHFKQNPLNTTETFLPVIQSPFHTLSSERKNVNPNFFFPTLNWKEKFVHWLCCRDGCKSSDNATKLRWIGGPGDGWTCSLFWL